MPSSYTTSLRLTLPATGELAGQWGNTVNTGITELLDAAVAGTTTISTWGGAGVSYTLSNNSGSADEARRMFIVATGTPGEAKNVICPAVSKFYVFRNDTTGGFALTLKTPSGTGVSVPAGQYRFLYCDGTNVVEMFNSVGSLTVIGALNAGSVNATTLDLTNLEVTNIKAKDGTASMTLADATGVATFSANPILNAGTANGVLYLNGSKVATSVSGFTFNGTTFSVSGNAKIGTGAASNSQTLMVNNPSGTATQIQLFQDGIESWTMGMPASSAGLAWAASGTEQMRLTSTGLGIGTSSPSSKLEVLNGGDSIVTITGNTASGNFAGVDFKRNTGTVNASIRSESVGANDAGEIIFQTRPNAGSLTTQMRLTSAGNLGIGTSSPLSKLTVAANMAAAGSEQLYVTGTSNTQQLRIGYNTTGNYGVIQPVLIGTGFRDLVINPDGGNLGIGTTPSYKLDVQTSAGRFQVQNFGAGSVLLYSNGALAYNAATTGHQWQLNGSEQMRLDSSGNLGIGTSSPGQRLEVANTGASFAAIKFTNSAASGGIVSYSNDDFLFYTGNTERMRLDASGNLGIGTSSPTARVHANAAGTSIIAADIGFTASQVNIGVGVLTAGRPFVGTNASSNPLEIGTRAATETIFVTNGTEKMRLDSPGNLGLGVTPSAWGSGRRAIQISSPAQVASSGITMEVGSNWYNDGTNYRYTVSNTASLYSPSNGAHAWYTAPSGTAGNAISFTQAMTLDASGNLLVNRTAVVGSEKLSVNGGARLETFADIIGGAGTPELRLYQNGGNWSVRNSAGALAFYDLTGSAERARITSGGNLVLGTTSASGMVSVLAPASGAYSYAFFDTSNPGTAYAELKSNGTTYGYFGSGAALVSTGAATQLALRSETDLLFSTVTTERARITSGGDLLVAKTNNTVSNVGHVLLTDGSYYSTMAASIDSTTTLHAYSTGAGLYRFYVGMGGTVYATNATITSISDQRLKENIRDLDAGLSEVMALKPRKFDWKPGKGKDKKNDRGWIAQEFEQVFPDMVDTWQDPAPEGEEPYKAVNADLIPVLVKAIQEQQALITDLRARVAALESQS